MMTPATKTRRTARTQPHAAFVREFLRNPGATAAVAPSSRKLSERMIDGVQIERCSTIVEFGPGIGVVTEVMLERLPRGWFRNEGGQGTLIAIEFNQRMAEFVTREFPRATVVNDSAEHIERICAAQGITPGTLDVVVSGLGWASFPPALTTSILEATHRMLRPGGTFRTFAYHIGLVKPNAWHLRSELKRLFGRVDTSRGVWANLPPAFVYRCVK